MQEYFLKERGIAYRTNIFIPGRKTLLLIHGLSGSLSAWYPFEDHLEKKYNLVTYDLRGHGLSCRPGRAGYAMAEFVEDTQALLKELRVEQATLVSHSFGALVAMEFARAYPERVAALVYLAPPYSMHTRWPAKVAGTIAAAAAVLPLRMRSYGRTDYARFRPTGDWTPSRIIADISNMGLRSYLFAFRLVFARDYDADWKLPLPTLILHGSKDTLVPVRYGRALAAALPHATFKEMKGANHILVLNNVPEVTREIENFVSQ